MRKYIRYKIKNVEPLRIADNSSSQSGQTMTLRYIPGSAVRGWLINQLAKEEDFEEIKKLLFSRHICFLNAFLADGKKELLPSPKGFYENKTGDQKIENVVKNGEFTEGNKRAAIGRYCYFEGNCIYYYGVDTGSDMKIKINLEKEQEKNNVFRNEYIKKGYTFTGYIGIDLGVEEIQAAKLEEKIVNAFGRILYLGNARSQGLGKCLVQDIKTGQELPYQNYMPESDQKESCYMMLLSNTTMRSKYGQYDGLNLEQLATCLDVQNLEIEHCSTTMVDVKGYNRNWGGAVPSVPMYEQGSVFRLKFEGTLMKQKMKDVMDQGIGIRRNEGFGRVLFLKDYENLTRKEDCTENQRGNEGEIEENLVSEKKTPPKEDQNTLKMLARNYYKKQLEAKMLEKILNGVFIKNQFSDSQVGTLRSIISANKNVPEQAWIKLHSFFENSKEKEQKQNTQKARNYVSDIEGFFKWIQRSTLEEILKKDFSKKISDEDFGQEISVGDSTGQIWGFSVTDLFTDEEKNRMKLQFLMDMIRFDNRKEE